MKLDRDSKLVKFSYLFHMLLHAEKNYPTGEIWKDPYGGEYPVRQYAIIPFYTSLCAFFWRTFVLVPGVLVGFTTAVGFVLYQLAMLCGVYTLEVAYVLRFAGLVAATVAVLAGTEKRWAQWFTSNGAVNRGMTHVADTIDRVLDSDTMQTFWQGLKAIKGKVCPRIELR